MIGGKFAASVGANATAKPSASPAPVLFCNILDTPFPICLCATTDRVEP